MSISEYISEYHTLLPTTIIVCAAFSVVLIAVIIVKSIIEKSQEKKSAVADIVLSEIDSTEDDVCEYKINETDGSFTASLLCNGETLIETEPYSSLAGVKSAVKSLKSNIENGNFTLKQNLDGEFSVKLYSSSKTLFESQPFESEEEAKEFVEKLTDCSKKATI